MAADEVSDHSSSSSSSSSKVVEMGGVDAVVEKVVGVVDRTVDADLGADADRGPRVDKQTKIDVDEEKRIAVEIANAIETVVI